MKKIPQWLDQWIQIDFSQVNIHWQAHDVKTLGSVSQITSLEAQWQGETQILERIQATMPLANPRIDCIWKPHLAPFESMVIGDLFFQSPAIVLTQDAKVFALIPDIDFIESKRQVPHYMDYVKPNNHLIYGLGHYEKTQHVYHTLKAEPFEVKDGQSLFKFYLVEWNNFESVRPLEVVSEFMWDYFGKERMKSEDSEVQLQGLETYVQHTYNWAFNHWKEVVWQEFEIEKQAVGAAVFIVRTKQKPGLGYENDWREAKSIWNQAWFSSLRSAYGYRLWGEAWDDKELIQKAELAKRFALSAPQKNGLFPSVFVADAEGDWSQGVWQHSNRRPAKHENYGHLLDMSWTALWMLKWYQDIEADEALLTYVTSYVKRLLALQQNEGNFPAWVEMDTGELSPYLLNSPETSMHAWLLAELYGITQDLRYLEASRKAIDFVIQSVIPNGRWEDFETYWSCSREWEGKQYGQKDARSGLYNQCNFSIYWTAEALLSIYHKTNDARYQKIGQSVLGELSFYQAVWDPPYVNVPVLGGFGVMNTDDEWNDARQSLFALTYLRYYQVTSKEEYYYRALWAMKASFNMMYCPENPEVKALYDKTFPFLDEKDYGFEMENAHHGENIEQAGEFTIFDWGNGSASASLAEWLLKNGGSS